MLSRMTRKMSYGICFMCCVSYNIKCWKIQSRIYCQRRSGALVDGCVSNNVSPCAAARFVPWKILFIPPKCFSPQVDELRMRVRDLEERERKESKKLADEDALRKIRVAEETIEHLQKKLAATKQVRVSGGGASSDFLSEEGWKLINFFIIPSLCRLVCCRHV